LKKIEEIKSHFVINDTEKKYVKLLQIGLILLVVSIMAIVAIKSFASVEAPSGFSLVRVLPLWAAYLVSAILLVYLFGFLLVISNLLLLALLTSEMHVHMRIALIIAFAFAFFAGLSIIRYLTGIFSVGIT
jgi:hypothetical protein